MSIGRIYRFKTDSVWYRSALRYCRPGIVITPGEHSSDMQQPSMGSSLKISWWRCVTLSLIDHRVGGADDLQVRGRFDVTFADDVCEVAKT